MKDHPSIDARAVSQASRLWKLYGFTSSKEVCVEDLALTLGLVVLHERLDSADARLVHNGKQGIIRISKDIPEPGRKRFAVVHEIGHWLLHKAVTQFVACTSEDMIAQYKASNAEYEANRFASEFTMPEHLFGPAISKKSFTVATLSELANDYDMSFTATAIRYLDLTSNCCAFAISDQTRIKWWRGSHEFEKRCWIKAGSAVAPETAAAKFFASGAIAKDKQAISTSAWLEYRNFVDQDILSVKKSPWSPTIFEQILVMPRYGQVLTLLSFP